MYLPGPPQRNWTRIFSECRFVYFSDIETDTDWVSERITNKGNILKRSEEGERAYVYLEVRKRRGNIYFFNGTSACKFS
jgi:hypothetical protein